MKDYSAKILADSVSPRGHRLTTFELTYPRFIHSEFMTHRAFSRNATSSRAIPIEKIIKQVKENPAYPIWWGKNQKGMQAEEELTGFALRDAKAVWARARDHAVYRAKQLIECGMHKQLVNRILEPWCWITVICSATDYGNFFNLRAHVDAQPEIDHIANLMVDAYYSNEPEYKNYGKWHLPLIGFPGDEKLSDEDKCKVSVGRCARVSYLTHDGKRDIQADIDLFERLKDSGHWSPFEHVACSRDNDNYYGNFMGWYQLRKLYPNENRAYYQPRSG